MQAAKRLPQAAGVEDAIAYGAAPKGGNGQS